MHFKRTAAAATMTALLAGGAAIAGIAPANAATPRLASCYDRFTLKDVNGFRGYLDWNAEPSGCFSKGDSFRVCDEAADGYGLYAFMLGLDRSATTQGHTSPYCSGWVGRDLTEGQEFTMEVDKVKDGVRTPLATFTLWA